MYDEQPSFPRLDFNLQSYRRDENGQVADIEDARTIIRNLHKIVQFLEVSAFAHLGLETQAEIALYLVGTYLLTHNSGEHDPEYADKVELLETMFNEQFDALIKQGHETLSAEDILRSVENMFRNFGA
jgi:hypothetical protein